MPLPDEDAISPFPVAIIDLGAGRMEPFDESFYPDGIIVYRLAVTTDSENVDTVGDGDPWPEIPCAIVDPRQGKPMIPGVDPKGSEMILIYTPIDPQITGVRQLIEVVKARGIVLGERKRLRTISEDRIPINIGPYWVINAKWES